MPRQKPYSECYFGKEKSIQETSSRASIYRQYSLNQFVNTGKKPTIDITVEVFIYMSNTLVSENKIGNAFLNKYEAHLKSLGNKGNTISIKMRTLNAVYNKAIKDNVVKLEYYPFSDYSVSKLKEDTVKRSITKGDLPMQADIAKTEAPHK